ncbi:MAG: Plug domain-containing protein, partial [Flavobacteriaceae bacterium]|nr:Plug domain-containing protein [Flavobacteriaceae bacterium]
SRKHNRKRVLSIEDVATGLFFDGIKAEDLGELIINAKQEETAEDEYSVTSNYLATEVNVDRTFANRFPNILDYIRFRGFFVDDFSEPGRVRITSRIRTSLNASQEPTIFLDGARLSDFGILYSLSSENIESITVDRTGASAGLLGANGIIRITSRRTPLEGIASNLNNKVSFVYTVKNGFEQPKRFFNPLYADYSSESFKKLGVLHWTPEIRLDPEKSQKIINVHPAGVRESLIFLEGISAGGRLVSKTLLLKSP